MRDRVTAALIAAMLILGGVLLAQSDYQGQAAKDNTQVKEQIVERPATIVAAAQAEKNLSDFSKNIERGQMVQTLESKGPFTVFAPTNEAFAACVESEKQKLADNKKLQLVLQYHVVPGQALTEADLRRMSGQKLMTVQGEELPILVENNVVWVGSAKLTGTEALTSNGVVHQVDDVLIPQLLMSRSMK